MSEAKSFGFIRVLTGGGDTDSFCIIPDAAYIVLGATGVPTGGLAYKALTAVNNKLTCSNSPLARCSESRLLMAMMFVLFRRE